MQMAAPVGRQSGRVGSGRGGGTALIGILTD